MANVFDFTATDIDGAATPLSTWNGDVLLITNVASKCGFTPQYEGLEALYERYRDRGFVVLGFPCNQFAKQEPGTADEIASFCEKNYGVTFPMYAKIDVNGAHTHPLYEELKSAAKGVLGSKAIKWNFTKFLVDRKGDVVERFGSNVDPAALDQPIERLL